MQPMGKDLYISHIVKYGSNTNTYLQTQF